jgi:hypothetical protein
LSFSAFNRPLVQISETLEGAFLAFRRRANVALGNVTLLWPAPFLIVNASAPALLNPVKNV